MTRNHSLNWILQTFNPLHQSFLICFCRFGNVYIWIRNFYINKVNYIHLSDIVCNTNELAYKSLKSCLVEIFADKWKINYLLPLLVSYLARIYEWKLPNLLPFLLQFLLFSSFTIVSLEIKSKRNLLIIHLFDS